MAKTLLDKPAGWLSGAGPDADVVVNCRGSLSRNLADLPFPARCSEEELDRVEERALSAFESANLFSTGRYCSLLELDQREASLLLERHLITPELVERMGPRGAYVSDDQCMSIMVNETDHVQSQALASGMQLDEIWARLNAVDDTLSGVLDYAFNERLGYLTGALDHVGTGLKLTAVLHLPGLTMANKILGLEQRVREQRHVLQGLFGNISEARGDLYQVSNQSTLGRSEEEVVYHLRHMAMDIVVEEKTAREAIKEEGLRGLEDRVWRARGIAQEVRLLDFDEAMGLLSSLRLGIATGMLQGYSLQQLNELLIASQRAHIEMKQGESCDELTLSKQRADLFRARLL